MSRATLAEPAHQYAAWSLRVLVARPWRSSWAIGGCGLRIDPTSEGSRLTLVPRRTKGSCDSELRNASRVSSFNRKLLATTLDLFHSQG